MLDRFHLFFLGYCSTLLSLPYCSFAVCPAAALLLEGGVGTYGFISLEAVLTPVRTVNGFIFFMCTTAKNKEFVAVCD